MVVGSYCTAKSKQKIGGSKSLEKKPIPIAEVLNCTGNKIRGSEKSLFRVRYPSDALLSCYFVLFFHAGILGGMDIR